VYFGGECVYAIYKIILLDQSYILSAHSTLTVRQTRK